MAEKADSIKVKKVEGQSTPWTPDSEIAFLSHLHAEIESLKAEIEALKQKKFPEPSKAETKKS